MTRFDAVDWIRRHSFPSRSAGGAARIGAEVEFLSLDADDNRPVSVPERLLPFLCRWSTERGGQMGTTAKGGIRVEMPDGGAFAIEPGGQIEYASPPCHGPSALLGALDEILAPLVAAAADVGINLVAAGVDPFNGPDAAPLQIVADRYCRMDAYFSAIGPAGRRMMRQTAAIQVSVDPAGPPVTTWRALNAAAPVFVAMFANSRRYAGRETDFASFRAETWRRADPARTGVFSCDGDAAAEYAAFALAAPVMSPGADGAYHTAEDWLRDGLAGETAWADHVSTLFPEVRPRGFFEVRSMDAQSPEDLRLPILLCAGLALDATAAATAADLLGPPDSALLEAAGKEGLRHARLAELARDLVAAGMEGCCRLGEARCEPADVERALERAETLLEGVPA